MVEEQDLGPIANGMTYLVVGIALFLGSALVEAVLLLAAFGITNLLLMSGLV